MPPKGILIWHGIYDGEKEEAYTRNSWQSSKSWQEDSVVTKEGKTYRDKHPEDPLLWNIPLPGRFIHMLHYRYEIDHKEVEFTYGIMEEEKIKAIAIVTPPDNFSKKKGRKIVVNRLNFAKLTGEPRSCLIYDEDEA